MERAWHRDYYRGYYHMRMGLLKDMLGGKCAVCGTVEDLEFDHIDPKTKTGPIGRLVNGAWETVVAEIEKCQLLCKPHHQEKSSREGSFRKNKKRKLTDEKIELIRKLYMRGDSQRWLAGQFGVTKSTIQEYVRDC